MSSNTTNGARSPSELVKLPVLARVAVRHHPTKTKRLSVFTVRQYQIHFPVIYKQLTCLLVGAESGFRKRYVIWKYYGEVCFPNLYSFLIQEMRDVLREYAVPTLLQPSEYTLREIVPFVVY